jgi:hypothetical protein
MEGAVAEAQEARAPKLMGPTTLCRYFASLVEQRLVLLDVASHRSGGRRPLWRDQAVVLEHASVFLFRLFRSGNRNTCKRRNGQGEGHNDLGHAVLLCLVLAGRMGGARFFVPVRDARQHCGTLAATRMAGMESGLNLSGGFLEISCEPIALNYRAERSSPTALQFPQNRRTTLDSAVNGPRAGSPSGTTGKKPRPALVLGRPAFSSAKPVDS